MSVRPPCPFPLSSHCEPAEVVLKGPRVSGGSSQSASRIGARSCCPRFIQSTIKATRKTVRVQRVTTAQRLPNSLREGGDSAIPTIVGVDVSPCCKMSDNGRCYNHRHSRSDLHFTWLV